MGQISSTASADLQIQVMLVCLKYNHSYFSTQVIQVWDIFAYKWIILNYISFSDMSLCYIKYVLINLFCIENEVLQEIRKLYTLNAI